MANDNANPPDGGDLIPPAKRKRLQQCFSHASKQMAQENYDYAAELFSQCVIGDPCNLSYVQSFIGNLQKKYGNNKTGAKLAQFKERGARGAAKKALSHEKWQDVIEQGLKVLMVNPWDKAALLAMAAATDKLDDSDGETDLYYLNCAWHGAPKDPDVNRRVAIALAERGQYDGAIASWHRVEQAKPDDEEAKRAIASLTVEKTINHGGYDSENVARKLGEQTGRGQEELTPEQILERRIAASPQEMSHYHELAQEYINKEDYKAAEAVYARAFEASDGDEDVRDRWDDVQLRYLRQQIAAADDEETNAKLRAEYDRKELDLYKRRAERFPNNFTYKYDLGVRLARTGQYNEAIREFQQARNDPRRKGVCMLALGQCFERINQNQLAMRHYAAATEDIPDRDAKNRKEALYLAGKMARRLKDLDTAEKHLTKLAELDFTYKDVSDLLEQISREREEE